jgi:hypothetical protein
MEDPFGHTPALRPSYFIGGAKVDAQVNAGVNHESSAPGAPGRPAAIAGCAIAFQSVTASA